MGEASVNDTLEHWVFAYGSLMWDPGFPVAESALARLDGFARRFCLRSIVHRGTIEAPGLVLALDQQADAHCVGLALRVAGADWAGTIAELRARELATHAYEEQLLPLALADGRHVLATSYVIRRDHDQYAGAMAMDAQARIIATAIGGRGPNVDYLFKTASYLARIGVEDLDMLALTQQVRALSEAAEKPENGSR